MIKVILLLVPFYAVSVALVVIIGLSVLGIAPWVTPKIITTLWAVAMALAATTLCVMAYDLMR